MKILIAVPTFENIYPDTFKSIYDLDTDGHEVVFEYVRGYDCATARNRIAQIAIDKNVDYVLMVDNDVVLPKEVLKWLTDNLKDVCLGYYAHRDSDNIYRGRTCICKLYDENGKKHFNYPLESEYTAKEFAELKKSGQYKVQIHGGGMGCALIKTDVFKTIEYPWYDWVNYKHRGMLSEDLYFCEQCKKHNIPIYTDTRVNCGHMLRHVQFAD
jgi:GT2 family glycosyltransferase